MKQCTCIITTLKRKNRINRSIVYNKKQQHHKHTKPPNQLNSYKNRKSQQSITNTPNQKKTQKTREKNRKGKKWVDLKIQAMGVSWWWAMRRKMMMIRRLGWGRGGRVGAKRGRRRSLPSLVSPPLPTPLVYAPYTPLTKYIYIQIYIYTLLRIDMWFDYLIQL